MSIIRMSPEFIATIEDGVTVRVVSGGAPLLPRLGIDGDGRASPRLPGVTAAYVEPRGYDDSPYTFVVEVDDGIEGERMIVFERVDE